jgi:hypothetical protein
LLARTGSVRAYFLKKEGEHTWMLAAVTAQYRAEVITMNQTARRPGEP